MAGKYRISKKVRETYKVIALTDSMRKRFINIGLELFPYLKHVNAIDFRIYFRVDDELIEYITPKNFQAELVDQIIRARDTDYDNLDICVERKDYARYHHLIQSIREKKIKMLLEKDPLLDRKTVQLFANLSNASQMIVRGGISKSVALEAKASAKHLIDNLLDSHVAISTLSRMVLADETLYDHSASVAMIAGIIARNLLGRSKTEAELCARGGLYHDVGKTCVPNHVLNKPGKFSPEEWEIMKTHTTLGFEELMRAIDSGAPIEEEVARVALEHHERFEGGGYPKNLKGRLEDREDGIGFLSRVVTIADVYSALLMKRVYKDAFDQKQSLGIMREKAPTDYDPLIWAKFEESVARSIDMQAEVNFAEKDDHGRIFLLDKRGLHNLSGKKKDRAS